MKVHGMTTQEFVMAEMSRGNQTFHWQLASESRSEAEHVYRQPLQRWKIYILISHNIKTTDRLILTGKLVLEELASCIHVNVTRIKNILKHF